MRVHFRTSISGEKKKKKKKKRNLQKRIFARKKRTAVFSFKKRTKYGKNVLVGSSVGCLLSIWG